MDILLRGRSVKTQEINLCRFRTVNKVLVDEYMFIKAFDEGFPSYRVEVVVYQGSQQTSSSTQFMKSGEFDAYIESLRDAGWEGLISDKVSVKEN